MGRYPDSEYLATPWWEDRDVTIRAHKLRMVTTRAPHSCPGNGESEEHEIPGGTRALYETCIYDGEWVQCWLCTDCMDAWLDHVNKALDYRPAACAGSSAQGGQRDGN